MFGEFDEWGYKLFDCSVFIEVYDVYVMILYLFGIDYKWFIV